MVTSLSTHLAPYLSTYLPTLRIKKGSRILLKLGTIEVHDELLFLHLRISAKQIYCGFTECRLAREVPTCPRGAICVKRRVVA